MIHWSTLQLYIHSIAAGFWFLWKNKNGICFNGKGYDHKSLVFKVLAEVENFFSFKKYTSDGMNYDKEMNNVTCSKLKKNQNLEASETDTNFTDINKLVVCSNFSDIQGIMENDPCTKYWGFCDASWIRKNGKAGLGFHFTNSDNEGLFMGFCNVVSTDVPTAELKAIWLCLLKANQLNIKHLKIFSDGKQAVGILNKESKRPWYTKALVKDILSIVDKVMVEGWLFFNRNCNTKAYLIAQAGLSGLWRHKDCQIPGSMVLF